MALYKGANKVAGSAGVGFNPQNAGTTGQVLKKTATGYNWDDESGAVTSVNGQTGAVTVSEFNPASSGTTNQILTKTADGYDWTNAPDSSNTKTFYISNTSDLTNAQAAYDWYIAGKNPIIMYNGTAYIVIPSVYPQSLCFSPTSLYIGRDNSKTTDGTLTLAIFYSGDTVTGIQAGTAGIRVLETDRDYSTPYTPTYDGSPATKKYVDDSISTAVSSAYKYKGSVSTYSALPASGNTTGDVWNVTDTDMNYAWTGTTWDQLGSTVDLSNYLAKNNTTAFTPTGDYNPATKKYVDDNKGTKVELVTQAQYDNIGSEKLTNGVLYGIIES